MLFLLTSFYGKHIICLYDYLFHGRTIVNSAQKGACPISSRRGSRKRIRKRSRLRALVLCLLLSALSYAGWRWGLLDPWFPAGNEKPPAQVPEQYCTNLIPADLSGYLLIDCLDVGQGDCTLIRQGNHAMLFDCGGEVPMIIRSYLRGQGVSELESVWLSHGDMDHIYSFPSIAYAHDIGCVYANGRDKNTEAWQYTMDVIKMKRLSLLVPAAGDVYALGDARIEVLGPLRTDEMEENNNSLVIRVVYGDTAVLLSGDAEYDEETDIALSCRNIRADVLHAGHHGSNSSSTRAFLEKVRPLFAVISCGAENDYGHPGDRALKRLSGCGAYILRTDENGTIRFISDGGTVCYYNGN